MMKLFRRGFWSLGLCFAAVLLSGCDTPDPRYNPTGVPPDTSSPEVLTDGGGAKKDQPDDQTTYHLRVGDDLVVTFLDGPQIQPIQDTIRDDGSITLINSQRFEAKGMTIQELQAAIHKRYVPDYYRTLTANITLANRYYYVNREVHMPNRYPYTGPIKVLEAINTAGGPTDFANMRKVTITRDNNRQITVDCVKALKDPKLNIWIYPGDRIDVPKSIF